MQLSTSPSSAVFARNLRTELRAKRPAKDALAIAYAAKRAADTGETAYTGGTVGPSLRHIDADGRMHVRVCHISKANVCPYKGAEIPDYQALGLDADKVYMLFRSPEELERAAPTFNNIQIMQGHIAVSAEDPNHLRVVGTTGSECVFNAPYLDNSVAVWTDDAIAGVESEEIKELTSAYRYRADMTPGTTTDGVVYDGVMRDIVGNHVALVPAGRAGPDVVVGDQEMGHMSKRLELLRTTLSPVLATDAKIDLSALLLALDAEMDDEEAEKKKAADKRAMDRAKDRKAAMDAMRAKDGEGEETDEERKAREDKDAAEDARRAADGEGEESDEDCNRRYVQDRKAAKDAKAKDAKRGKDEPMDEPVKDKKAMDAAISAGVDAAVTRMNAVRDAERKVRPYVGEIMIAMDSADEVYKFALNHLGIKVAGVHPSAYETILAMQPKPGAVRETPRMAMDAYTSAADLFPDAARIGQA